MICLIALVVFGVLGIFSATHRTIAKEAFDCVFKKITFRKCTTGLDQRLKSQITGKFMRKNPKVGAFVFKRFEIISMIFTILLIASLGYSGYSVFNLVVYGNCNGPIPDAFCVFDVFNKEGRVECTDADITVPDEIMYPTADDDPFIGPEDAAVTFIEFGCFGCEYTKKAAPIMEELIKEFSDRVKFVYRDFPLSMKHEGAVTAAEAAQCAFEQNMFWEYHDRIFENGVENIGEDTLKQYAVDVGLDTVQFNECFDTDKHHNEVEKDYHDGVAAGVTGTPTFFINNRTIYGFQTYKVLKKKIDQELSK